MRALRVLHVIPTLYGGGAENFLCALAEHLDDRIVQVSLMSIYPTPSPLPVNAEKRIPVIQIGRRGRYDAGFLRRMVREIRTLKPDIVHTHLHNGKYWGRLAALFSGVPIVLFTEHNPCGEHRILPEIVVDYLVNRFTSGIITFADTQRAILMRGEGLPASKVIVIENGIALPPPPTAERRSAARSLLGVSPGQFAVLVLARLIQRKNQQLAIRALAHLSTDSRSRIRLYIIGSGEDERLLTDIAESAGVSKSVMFMGDRPDAVQLLYGGDLLFMPSLAEGMPLAVLEAMTVGLPVASAPWTGVDQLLRQGELGTILTDWDPLHAATFFESALLSPQPLQDKAVRAMDVARNVHDIRRVARLHEDLYLRLAEAEGLGAVRRSASFAPGLPRQ